MRVKNHYFAAIVPLLIATQGVTSLNAYSGTELDYPELNVVPRYSDRLDAEAQSEKATFKRWGVYASLLTPYIATAAVGGVVFNPALSMSHWLPISIGGLGILGMGLAAVTHHPYQAAWADVQPLKNGNTREKLYRERIAQEEIEQISRTGIKLMWFSAGLNFFANAYLLISYASSGEFTGNPNGRLLGVVAGSVGALLSLTPLIFRPYWIDVAQEQESYRKRIFAPVAGLDLFAVPSIHGGVDYFPGVRLLAYF